MSDASTSRAPTTSGQTGQERPLSLDEYERYGRQMILPGFGLPGQLKLKAARVAVIGAGGLGCPVLQYLAGAGVGNITVVDHDTVSVSNLHRQVLHTTERVGMNKAESASLAMRSLNPHVKVHPVDEPISPSNATSLLANHEMIVDCTDRPYTRYLLSDTAVTLKIPLVSGAAISSAGQWAVYGGQTTQGKQRACYRCMWPRMVNAGGNDRCEELGVWGVVTGLVGTGMASEVIKLLIGNDDQDPLLHLLHLGGNPLVRTIRIRPPSPKCEACGPNANIRVEEFDYDAFCAGPSISETSEGDDSLGDGIGEVGDRIGAKELSTVVESEDVLVVDTRPEIEFEICSIPGTINIPLASILSSPKSVPPSGSKDIVFICKKGNDSQIAARALRKRSKEDEKGGEGRIRDVRGGLIAWSKEVDHQFPLY